MEDAPGVLTPVRLPNAVSGVVYRTAAPAKERAKSPFEIFDCRLVLALSDFSKILLAHDIDEVQIFSAWRPPPPKWDKAKLATRHPGALAVDAFRFGKKLADGQKERVWLDVERDFGGKLGAPMCGPLAPMQKNASQATKELRSIVCEAAAEHLFTVILTPNYDRAHHNHVHLEVTPSVTWYLVR